MIEISTTTSILSSEFWRTLCLFLGLECLLLSGVGPGVGVEAQEGVGEVALLGNEGTVKCDEPRIDGLTLCQNIDNK